MVKDIAVRLVKAARCGDGVLLDEIDKVNPRHLKCVLAALAKVAAQSDGLPPGGHSVENNKTAETDDFAAFTIKIGPAGSWSPAD
jgi:hypothetical protein